jgi:hypothetical protein
MNYLLKLNLDLENPFSMDMLQHINLRLVKESLTVRVHFWTKL